MEKRILVIDDDPSTRLLFSKLLTEEGYTVAEATNGREGLGRARKFLPDLILLDHFMPGWNGYEVCERFQRDPALSRVPVIFVTATGDARNRIKAFSCGAVDYLVKPCHRDALLAAAERHLKTGQRWEQMGSAKSHANQVGATHVSFLDFLGHLADRLTFSDDEVRDLSTLRPEHIYGFARSRGMSDEQMAKLVAESIDADYIGYVEPESIELGLLPPSFCRFNGIVPVEDEDGSKRFVMANPFLLDVIDVLQRVQHRPIIVTEPRNLEPLFEAASTNGCPAHRSPSVRAPRPIPSTSQETSEANDQEEMDEAVHQVRPQEKSFRAEATEDRPVERISDNILAKAILSRASDIHIEPKETETKIRLRVDGQMEDAFAMKRDTGQRVISRLKVLASLDISVKRRPQDGAFDLQWEDRKFRCRVATTGTPNGESMVIRLLEPDVKPKSFVDLGMTDDQSGIMEELSEKQAGLILIVGPTGSGKSTTVFSLLSRLDGGNRSLMSVEDPVEYRIPSANQQQVNEKAGVTFETLLKSAVRQDPDVLFVGEIRDSFSAKIAVEAASTGHLVVSTLHTSNAATSVFRLQMLGVSRGQMAESLLAIVAQRLVRILCPHCAEMKPIREDEKVLLYDYFQNLPGTVGHAPGCPRCDHTGYRGRSAVCEILRFTPAVAGMVRGEKSVPEIYAFMRAQGGYMMSDHALSRVEEGVLSLEELHRKVLTDSIVRPQFSSKRREDGVEKGCEAGKNKSRRALVIDDDKVSLQLVEKLLSEEGYDVTTAEDGIDALICLGGASFDVILSDLRMPNLDGYRLMEMKQLKGIRTPVVFLTASQDDETEIKVLAAGAADYVRKPFGKADLLARLERVVGGTAVNRPPLACSVEVV